MKATNFFVLAWLSLLPVYAQDSTNILNQKRLHTVLIAGGAAYTATLIGLNNLWYSQSEKQSFRFFNDNDEWKQVDKMGHFFTAFHFSSATSATLQWANVEKRKADLWGSVTGFLILLPIEIMDGFSADYGASGGDLLANAAGSAFFLGQSLIWKETRIQPKFSFQRTGYPALRTDGTLGEGMPSEIIKDYNGQTYWLSVDLDKFFHFPKWLNLAVGYGANEMVYACDHENQAAGYNAFRQYYVGIDFDLSHIRTKSKALNTALFLVNMIRLPAPAFQFSKNGNSFQMFQF
ncbi:MAG: YfiM family protein [Cyclobacteriaceae bacterium]|nr:YfiM family protein [Cyclobacteriaceae bacterium]